ncbi:pleckstrin homology-like domain family B member 2 [Galendromus occidentalis]|uniref:Pleckstrin homology-like domain family B member 2 n=1 Tax=Galendromus occidentalis TaxID=34638 RepID=A0AAJ6QTG9_9ACAR|nr:pleckstrin homology-like domain family B member 2 [Galendromus occidentalis]
MTCESPVEFLVNPAAYEVTPQRSRLQSYPQPHLMPKSILSPLQGVEEEEYRCFSLPRFDKAPIPEPAPLCSLSAHDLMGLAGSASSEQLRQREEELTEQHRKVVQERLQEQEEERDARQRLEDIINMCAKFVSTSNVTSPPGQLKSPRTSRKSPSTKIKTNGSFKATTPSSEDELTAINNGKESVVPTPMSPSSPPQSPRNRIKTVPGISSPKDNLANGAVAIDFRTISSTATTTPTNGQRNDNKTSKEKLAPQRSTSLQKMAAHIHAAQASLLQSQFMQLEAAFKEQLDELQMELALVTGELCDEQFSLKEDLIQYGKLEAEQEILLDETMREKDDEQSRLQLAGERIFKWQELTVKMAETLDDPVSPILEREISERLENEVECLEAEKRAYEDLEFQIMESTARREERIEEVNQRVVMMGRLIEQKEQRIQELQLQQKAIAEELESKKRNWEDQQRSHQNNLKVVQQQQQSSLDSESLSGSESDTESEYQHSNCGSEMVSSSTESEELFSPKTSAALGQMGVSLRNNNRRVSQRPLTCYLPVFPDQGHFDLRVHIASCGHQLEMCATDVVVDTNSCRGYLYKLGSASRWWKKRWFLFDRSSRALMYFMDKTERKLKGLIHFESIDDVYVDHGNKKMAAFCVKTLDRVYHLSSTSPEAMRVWVDVIFSGAHGYNRFLGQD